MCLICNMRSEHLDLNVVAGIERDNVREALEGVLEHCKHPVSLMIILFLSPMTQANPTFWLLKVP